VEVLHHLDYFQLRIYSYRYVFYRPGCQIPDSLLVYLFYPETAGRSLEDIDRFFAGNAPLFVFKDKEAIAEKRPQVFIEREKEAMRRNSSVVPGQVAAANRAHEKTQGDEFNEDV
jgi:hypothetical protein